MHIRNANVGRLIAVLAILYASFVVYFFNFMKSIENIHVEFEDYES